MASLLKAAEDFRPWPGGLTIAAFACSKNERGLRSPIDDVIGDDPDARLLPPRDAAIVRALKRWRKHTLKR